MTLKLISMQGYSSTHPPTDNGSKASVLLAGFLGQVCSPRFLLPSDTAAAHATSIHLLPMVQVVQHLISLLGKLVQLLMGRRLAGKRIAEASAATPGQGTLPRSLQPATRRPNSEFQVHYCSLKMPASSQYGYCNTAVIDYVVLGIQVSMRALLSGQSAGDGENLTDVAPQGRDPGVDTSTRPLPRMVSNAYTLSFS